MDEREVEAVRRTLLSGWVTQGPEVKAFENEFSSYVGSKHACAISSCTTGLHLALKAVGVGKGDEVITVSHTFIATANSIRYCRAEPVFVDIDPDTYNINPELIESSLSEKTRAILCVHQMGMPCDLKKILQIARENNLPVIEDAACAIDSEINWKGNWEKIGKPHGDIACFSFHPRKIITTGEGGMLTTNNSEYDKKFRLWRQHSMSVPDTVRHQAKSVIFEEYTDLGYNYRMTDIQASIGRVQLLRLPEIIASRQSLAKKYFEQLTDIPGLDLPFEPEWAKSNWQSFCIRLPEGLNQKGLMQKLLEKGISTRRGIIPIHQERAYELEKWSCGTRQKDCNCSVNRCKKLEESEKAGVKAIILPLYPHLTESEQNNIIVEITAFCKKKINL